MSLSHILTLQPPPCSSAPCCYLNLSLPTHLFALFSLSLSLIFFAGDVMSFLALSSGSCVCKNKKQFSLSLSLTHSLTLSQNLLLFSVCGLCRFYDLILKWNQSTANKFACSSNGQMIRHVWAHQLLLIHAFAPENPLLFS